ncbi:hypothetical protein B0E46_04780 [Rhodanobacter sp. B04]|uniref:hypothetical protein n=1 Tax=Rhodanobacter sp. B04 TaxID=1945860 RepID=UPI0009877F8C|nr:hypothetical protein [Rhodanobacter sp. B04]OOG64730.1 hypothetical protein B0E46_04780 [Rhodanobacter sp. B04]
MSNVIDFLEKMGQDAQLRHASAGEVELALAHAQLDPELQMAILAKDQQQLEAILGKEPMCCLLFPVKEGEEDSEEAPSKDDDEVTLQSSFYALASVG